MSEGLGTTAPSTGASNSINQAAQQQAATAQQRAAKSISGQQTKDPPAQTTPVPSFKGTKHKVKVDGRETEVDYDELLSGYNLKQASFERFQQAANKEKMAQAFIAAVEANDYKPFEEKYGKQKLKEWMENYLIGDLEEEELKKTNPSEYRARELERQLKQKEAAEKEAEERKKEEEKKTNLLKAQEQIDQEVHEALSKLGRKPTPRIAARIVDEMIIRLEGKKQKISGEEASKYAFKAIEADISEYLPTLSDEQLLSVIPQQVIDRIRQHEVDKVMTQKSTRRVKAPDSGPSKQAKPKNIDAWFETREKQLKRRG